MRERYDRMPKIADERKDKNTCVACGGTGKASKGGRCSTCNGTGRKQPPPSVLIRRSE